MALSEEVVHKYSDLVLAKLNRSVAEVRRLFLVEDLVDSLKVSREHGLLGTLGGLLVRREGVQPARPVLLQLCPLSLQFAALMWILTYVGALFNGLTLLILGEWHHPPL